MKCNKIFYRVDVFEDNYPLYRIEGDTYNNYEDARNQLKKYVIKYVKDVINYDFKSKSYKQQLILRSKQFMDYVGLVFKFENDDVMSYIAERDHIFHSIKLDRFTFCIHRYNDEYYENLDMLMLKDNRNIFVITDIDFIHEKYELMNMQTGYRRSVPFETVHDSKFEYIGRSCGTLDSKKIDCGTDF